MQAYPNFDAVFGANDEMIIGAIEAMSAAGIDLSKTKVTVGFDATAGRLPVHQAGQARAPRSTSSLASRPSRRSVPRGLHQEQDDASQNGRSTSTRDTVTRTSCRTLGRFRSYEAGAGQAPAFLFTMPRNVDGHTPANGGHQQELPGRHRAFQGRLRPVAGGGARAGGRERGGQVHADEDPCGRLPGGRGRDLAQGPQDHRLRPPVHDRRRGQRDLPGAQPRSLPLRGGEHLPGPRTAQGRWPDRLEDNAPGSGEAAGAFQALPGPPRPHQHDRPRLPAGRGDREGALAEGGHHRHGRADRPAHGKRGGPAFRDHPQPQGGRGLRRLHLPPAGGAPRGGRPRHGAAGRASGSSPRRCRPSPWTTSSATWSAGSSPSST